MINRTKISDGDLLFITIGGDDVSNASMDSMRRMFESWTKERGLQNVKVSICGGAEGRGIQIDVLSVNDIFGDTVLNGNST